jgi:2-haloacid dehalogenase
MPLDRREFLRVAAGSIVANTVLSRGGRAATRPQLKAIAFDAFAIFDPRPVFALAEALFPEKGMELGNAWRTRQFEYQWLRTLSGRSADFWQTTEDGLVFSAKLLQLELTPDKRARLMRAYLELNTWPDVPLALSALKRAGVRLAFLSNITAKMLDAGIKNAGLDGVFEHILSTDQIRAYNPDPRVYQMAIARLSYNGTRLFLLRLQAGTRPVRSGLVTQLCGSIALICLWKSWEWRRMRRGET